MWKCNFWGHQNQISSFVFSFVRNFYISNSQKGSKQLITRVHFFALPTLPCKCFGSPSFPPPIQSYVILWDSAFRAMENLPSLFVFENIEYKFSPVQNFQEIHGLKRKKLRWPETFAGRCIYCQSLWTSWIRTIYVENVIDSLIRRYQIPVLKLISKFSLFSKISTRITTVICEACW